MDQTSLNSLLATVPLGEVRYLESVGSTNDEAFTWAHQGAPDLSVVIADEQTMGRGRLDRPWFTPPGTALAISLIFRPTSEERHFVSRLVGLAALAITETLRDLGLSPEIKWPNDILLNQRKVAGVLIEASWADEEVDFVVIGMGMNIFKKAVPDTDILRFPGTSIESALDRQVERETILRSILEKFVGLRTELGADSLMNKWGTALAYRGRQVKVEMGGGQTVAGKLEGILADGSLRLKDDNGKSVTVQFGDVRLRPFTDILSNKTNNV